MSHLSNAMNNASEASNGVQAGNNENHLEDLLLELHKHIKSGDWLQVNTVSKMEKENPELLKGWHDAITKDEPTTN
jgi:hypothetical protein